MANGLTMVWTARVALVLGTLLLVQGLVALLDGYRFLGYVRRSRRSFPWTYAPQASVIIPCKGIDADFELNLSRFLAQDYPRYQIIFVVASENDSAYKVISAALQGVPERKGGAEVKTALAVAGISWVRGEKVNNLLHGLRAVGLETEVLVFADIDARPQRDWLRSLVGPLADPKVTVSTGFRWYLPGARFVSQLRAAWDTSIATLLGEHNHNFAWGGSMAIRSVDFKRLRVAEHYWARTVSDDYALTSAVRDAGGRIHFEPRCLLPCRENSTFREFLRWANRQIIITRVYSPGLWWLGLLTNAFYCTTILLGIVSLILPGPTARERAAVAGLLAANLLMGLAKGRIRSIVARESFSDESETLALFGPRYWQLAPLIPWLMLFNFIAAGLTRRIVWRGTHYELRSRQEVRVLQRDDR
jgi:cellulose synthase/poly-beta-1,6-N-acetylglucosamine synthase-like glycosyltransferase